VAHRNPYMEGMGTTLTMAYFLDPYLLVNHVGDSRCYLSRRNKLQRLTQDHTLAAEMVRHGCLSPDQEAKHQWRHLVTNIVGGEKGEREGVGGKGRGSGGKGKSLRYEPMIAYCCAPTACPKWCPRR